MGTDKPGFGSGLMSIGGAGLLLYGLVLLQSVAPYFFNSPFGPVAFMLESPTSLFVIGGAFWIALFSWFGVRKGKWNRWASWVIAVGFFVFGILFQFFNDNIIYETTGFKGVILYLSALVFTAGAIAAFWELLRFDKARVSTSK